MTVSPVAALRPAADLRRLSVRGGTITVSAQMMQFGLTLASTAVLARLLTPGDFGLFAMTASIVNLMVNFADLGLSQATVRSETITQGQLSSLFWLNMAAGALLAGGTVLFAPAISAFYHEPRLTGLTCAMAFSLLLAGAAVQHRALLQRAMSFATLSTVSVAASLVGAMAAVGAAWAGAGYWSLAAMPLGEALVTVVAVWIVMPWRPSAPARGAAVRAHVRFGGYLSGFNLLNYLSRNMDNVLIGSVWGAQPLGLYSRAYSLLVLPLSRVNAPVNAVALPLLGRLQSDGPRFNAAFVRMMSTLTSITLPGIAFLTVMAHEICAVVLGPQWGNAADIFQVLGIASAAQAITNPLGVVMMATGRTDRSFRLALVTTPATIVAFMIGLPHGAIGVASAYAVYTCVAFLPTVWYACRESPVKALAVLGSAGGPAVVAATIVAALLLFRHSVPPGTAPIVALLGAGGIAAALWGILHTTVFRATSPLALLREMRS